MSQRAQQIADSHRKSEKNDIKWAGISMSQAKKRLSKMYSDWPEAMTPNDKKIAKLLVDA